MPLFQLRNLALAAVGAVSLAGCATYDPYGGVSAGVGVGYGSPYGGYGYGSPYGGYGYGSPYGGYGSYGS